VTRHLVESGVTQFLDIGSGIPLVSWTRAEFAALFGGSEQLEPGAVPLATWRPDSPPDDPHEAYYARKNRPGASGSPGAVR
jgi:S-adenosyl methyltransferase